MRFVSFLALAVLFPVFAHAAVAINEIAWMGTAASANAEWMELENTGSAPVDITGWHLVASNGSPSITLAGTIAASGFFLLERTSDASVPSVTADQIYTGALTNSGATLTLTDTSGNTIDQVIGGANWVDIGGDNANKETAQRTASGWETAAATPHAVNAGVSIQSNSNTGSTPTTSSVAASTTESASIVHSSLGVPEYLPIPTLRIVSGGNRTLSSGADVAFSAAVYDSKSNKRDDAIITYAFGDGMRRTGASVFHRYYSSGEYVVVVHATTADGGDALAENIITVQDANIKITSVTPRGITLANSGTRTLDLSFWRLSEGGQEFTIPADTQILAGRTILFPSQVIELPIASSASLLFPSGEVAARFPEGAISVAASVQPSAPGMSFNEKQTVEPALSKGVSGTAHEITAVRAPAAATELAAAGAALPASSTSRATGIFKSPWALSFLGVVALAGTAFILL